MSLVYEAVKDLLLAIQKTRYTAKSVFAGREDVLREFASIKRAKATKKDKEKRKPASGAGAASSPASAGV